GTAVVQLQRTVAASGFAVSAHPRVGQGRCDIEPSGALTIRRPPSTLIVEPSGCREGISVLRRLLLVLVVNALAMTGAVVGAPAALTDPDDDQIALNER